MLSHLMMSPASGRAYRADGTVVWLSDLLQQLVLDTESNEALLAGEIVEWDGVALVARVEVALRDGAIRPVLVAVDNAPTEGYLPGQDKDLAVSFEFLVGVELFEAQAVIGTGANGQVIIEVLVPGPGGLAYSVLVDASLTLQDRFLTAVLVGTALTVTLAVEGKTKSAAAIGSGVDGEVAILVAAPGTDGDLYSVLVDADLAEQDRPLSATLEGAVLTVDLATKGDTAAGASIGSGANGTVDVLAAAPGTEGNDYGVEVDADLDEQDRPLSAALNGTTLLVELATEGDVKAGAAIGAGANGTVNVLAAASGSEGNAGTIEVNASLTVERILSAEVATDAVLVKLATETIKAGAVIGSGESGAVNVLAATPGAGGNASTIAVDADLATQDRPLHAAAAVGAITVELATEGDAQATARIGDCDENNIDILVDAPGSDGNGHTVEVVVAVGNNQPMGAAIVGTDITVTLGTGAGGAPDAAKNIAELVATAISNLAGVSADTPGAGTHPLSAVEAPKSLTGGTNKLAAAANTATLVAAAVDGLPAFEAAASGTGADALTVAEGPTQFSGGGIFLDTAGNTATLVAGAVDALLDFEASASGDGSASLTLAEGPTQFAGGTNRLAATANTATLAAGVVDALPAFTATPTGDGSSPLTLAEGPTPFSGGTNQTDDAANTAHLVAAEIDALDAFEAADTGTGLGPLTAAEGPTQFDGGENQLVAADNTAALVAEAVAAVVDGEGAAVFRAEATGTGADPLTVDEGPTQFSGGANAAEIWMPWHDPAGAAVDFTAAGSSRRVYGPFDGWPLFQGGRLVLTAGEAPAAGTRTVVYVRTA